MLERAGATAEEKAFRDFYRALHPGREPHAWQVRAALELTAGRLFDRLSAPTGAGKTTLVECFVFALARQGAAARTLPLRLFWVIDRRAVVDQVFEGVQALADRLNDPPPEGPRADVATQLRGYGGTVALQTARWRGGLERDVLRLSPVTPTVICSTVDQVGSRLLFRGYGTSRRSRPIDAALVGTDSLVILDEAHLSAPFVDTARPVATLQRAAPRPAVRPLHVAEISATLALPGGESTFELTPSEREEPELRRRLRARKLTTFRRVGGRIDGLAREARRLADGRRVVGVVANTVGDARAVHNILAGDSDALLVIGPSRPLEREGLLRIVPDRDARSSRTAPLFVVATQTIEVGVDLDFDALVTAAAPLPALVQRLGRLDRAGTLGTSEAVVVASRQPCPVYGAAAEEAWEWLAARAGQGRALDLGPRAVERMLSADDLPAPPETPRAPLLCPWHLEALAQTSEDPVPSPDVAPFLHGERALDAADVSVAWRADLREGEEDSWSERVAARPPRPGELLSLSVAAVRRWLRREDPAAISDVESISQTETDRRRQAPTIGRQAMRVPPPSADGPSRPERIDPAQIRPGDLIVVPAAAGGCDEFGWAPTSSTAVRDLADLASERRLLLDLTTVPAALADPAKSIAEELAADLKTPGRAYDDLIDEARHWLAESSAELAEVAGGVYADALRRLDERLSPGGHAVPIPLERPSGLLLVAPSPVDAGDRSKRQAYGAHVSRVEELAEDFAQRAGLEALEVTSVALAGRHHDAGKLDPRFQAWLTGGSPANPAEPLAKSGRRPSRARAEAERIVAGWPRGKRHEALSAALVAVCGSALLAEADRDLVLHLIATHHGQHRPFYPRQDRDTAPAAVQVELDGELVVLRSDAELPWSEAVERFSALAERYGPWGLAGIEAALVLADRQASAEAEE